MDDQNDEKDCLDLVKAGVIKPGWYVIGSVPVQEWLNAPKEFIGGREGEG